MKHVASPLHPGAGFTLVEMLVVLAIIAIATGAVAIGMGAGHRDASEVEAHRLATRLSLAADEAMVDDTPLAFDWSARRYRFLRQGEAGWAEDRSDALAAHDLPDGIGLQAPGTSPLAIGADDGGIPLDVRVGRRLVRFDGVTAVVTDAGS